ncbi:MAG: hypothetical protein GDA35_08350 [Hyphomonadaceae bacterium]|nr:hypothetical protein [Hyphomonadaceae bacterium]
MKRNLYLVGVLMVLMLGLATYKSTRPDADILKFRVLGGYAYGYGVTKSRSLSDFRHFINANPDVHTLVLVNMPGTQDLVTNTKIARLIRSKGLDTHLPDRGRIASGAVDLFIAGTKRTMDCGAQIGVHSWRLGGSPNSLVKNDGFHPQNMGTDRYRRAQEIFLYDMGVDPDFYVFTREAAPPEDIYYLTPEEIERFGLLTEPADCR